MGYKINDLKLFGNSKKKATARKKTQKKTNIKGLAGEKEQQQDTSTPQQSGMNNELNMRIDFSLRDQSAINRDILTGISQATSGTKAIKVSFSAEYTLSKLLTMSLYYDYQNMQPLLTSSSYPTTTQDFGMSFRFSLIR